MTARGTGVIGVPESGLAMKVDSPGRQALRRLLRHRLAMVGIFVIIMLAVLAILGDEFRAYDQRLKPAFVDRPPGASPDSLLGTDALGRDILARLLVGGRISILVAVLSVALSTFIGTLVGVLAGYLGGKVDNLLMRIVDVVLSFPGILLLLVASAIVGPGVATLIVIIGLVSWAPASRIVRGQTLALRESTFIEAARVIGVSNGQVILKHILPNIVAPVIVFATFGIASVIIFEAGLSYLGLGVQPPTPSWGNMLIAARSISVLERYPWQWAFPAGCIVLMVLAVNFVGDGLRDALDRRASSAR